MTIKSKYYDGDAFKRDVFKIFVDQLIIRNACKRYYPKKAIWKYENFHSKSYIGFMERERTILDNLDLAKEMSAYLKDWFY